MTKAGVALNTNVLKIALNQQDEKVAAVLVAEYVVKIEEEMILRALKTNKFYFLYCLWAFNKNYSDSTGKVFTFDYLFRKIIEICEDKA